MFTIITAIETNKKCFEFEIKILINLIFSYLYIKSKIDVLQGHSVVIVNWSLTFFLVQNYPLCPLYICVNKYYIQLIGQRVVDPSSIPSVSSIYICVYIYIYMCVYILYLADRTTCSRTVLYTLCVLYKQDSTERRTSCF